MRLRKSLEGKIVLLACALSAAAGLLTAGFTWVFYSILNGLLVGLLISIGLCVYAVRHFMHPVNRLLMALGDGVGSFQDGDFSVTLKTGRDDELDAPVQVYNAAGELLRKERHSLYQRELMLDTVIQSTPWALVLTNANDCVVYSNVAARKLFQSGRRFEGQAF
ncbi:MAG TPA: hypothetical protein VGM47_00420 [Gammaproteobacteria bacterium]